MNATKRLWTALSETPIVKAKHLPDFADTVGLLPGVTLWVSYLFLCAVVQPMAYAARRAVVRLTCRTLPRAMCNRETMQR